MAKKVMVVDDSRTIRQLVSVTLEAAGYEVNTAEDGKMALDKVVSFNPNLIICDVNMPNLNGIEFVRAMKNDASYEAFKFAPIVMLTTESSEEKRTEGQLAGASAWMVKPFLPARVLSVVEKIIGVA